MKRPWAPLVGLAVYFGGAVTMYLCLSVRVPQALVMFGLSVALCATLYEEES